MGGLISLLQLVHVTETRSARTGGWGGGMGEVVGRRGPGGMMAQTILRRRCPTLLGN